MFNSVEEQLIKHARFYGPKEAVRAESPKGNITSVSYEELLLLTIKAAGLLSYLSVRRGDYVGLVWENTPEILILELGIALLGAIIVPLDHKKIIKSSPQIETSIKALFIRKGDSQIAKISKYNPHLRHFTWDNFADWKNKTEEYKNFKPIYTADLSNAYLFSNSQIKSGSEKNLLSQRECFDKALAYVSQKKLKTKDKIQINDQEDHLRLVVLTLAYLTVGGTIQVAPST